MPGCPINKVLKGQKALVTGANSGIGQAVALALAYAGADAVVNYVSRLDAAEAVVKEAMRCGANVYAHKANVANEAEVQAMFKKMIQEFGTIDILVNNAGLQKDASIDKMTLSSSRLLRASRATTSSSSAPARAAGRC
jgi:glucose 1-dehydrogenase